MLQLVKPSKQYYKQYKEMMDEYDEAYKIAYELMEKLKKIKINYRNIHINIWMNFWEEDNKIMYLWIGYGKVIPSYYINTDVHKKSP